MFAHKGWLLLCLVTFWTLHPHDPRPARRAPEPPGARHRPISWKWVPEGPPPGPGEPLHLVSRTPRLGRPATPAGSGLSF